MAIKTYDLTWTGPELPLFEVAKFLALLEVLCRQTLRANDEQDCELREEDADEVALMVRLAASKLKLGPTFERLTALLEGSSEFVKFVPTPVRMGHGAALRVYGDGHHIILREVASFLRAAVSGSQIAFSTSDVRRVLDTFAR